MLITPRIIAEEISHSLYFKAGYIPFAVVHPHHDDKIDSIESDGTAWYGEYLFRYGSIGAGVFTEYQSLFTTVKGDFESTGHRNTFRTAGLNARYYFTEKFYGGAGIGHRMLVKSGKWGGNEWKKESSVSGRIFTGAEYRLNDLVFLNAECAISGPVTFNQFDAYKTPDGETVKVTDTLGGAEFIVYLGACARFTQN